MPKVWDSCKSCGLSLVESQTENWRDCSKCRLIIQSVKLFLSLALIILWTHYQLSDHTHYQFFITVGLSFDIFGAWLLANGYSDLFAMAAGGLGGGASTLKKYGSSHFWKRMLGLGFLTLGFMMQGLANF
jgi:hypothetical protein